MVVCVNMNGMNEGWKKREIRELFTRGKVEILGVGETHPKGCGVLGYEGAYENGQWEGLEKGVIWAGIEQGRGEERKGVEYWSPQGSGWEWNFMDNLLFFQTFLINFLKAKSVP